LAWRKSRCRDHAHRATQLRGRLARTTDAGYLFALLARASSRKGRAGFPATDALGGSDFVTTAPAEIFVPAPTMSGFSGLPLTIVAPAPTNTPSSITT